MREWTSMFTSIAGDALKKKDDSGAAMGGMGMGFGNIRKSEILPEPLIMLVGMCEMEEVDVSVGYGGTTYAQRTVTKDQFTILVVIVDILAILLLMGFYSRLEV